MFSRNSRPLFRSTTLRLTALYSVIFICSALVLFLLAYSLLSNAVREGDRAAMAQKLREYVSVSQKKGLSGLLDFLRLERENIDVEEYLLRVTGPDGTTLFSQAPEDAAPLPDTLPLVPGPSVQWDFMPGPDPDGGLTEIGCRALPGGGSVAIGKDASERESLLARFRVIFAGIMAPVALLGLAAGFILARRVLTPLKDLIDTVRAIDTGRMDARVPEVGAGDELSELARLFNAMLDKIRTLITGMREALDNVAHDLRTPATRTLAAVEMAVAVKNDPAELREALLDCAEETRRMVSMLGALMDISEAETGAMRLRLEAVDMARLAAEAAELYEYVAEEKGVELSVAAAGPLPVLADPNRLRQVLANLIDNAVKYTPTGGRATVAAAREGDAVAVRVTDTGQGIAAEDQSRIFDRLYRADRSRSERGLGLGLSLVRAVLFAHGAAIEVESELGRGSVFAFRLPLAADP